MKRGHFGKEDGEFVEVGEGFLFCRFVGFSCKTRNSVKDPGIDPRRSARGRKI